ncbi:MAG: type I-A CRISPR-associated protein Cas4/Csa1 [Aigarchaeota archaeon]|nr:type I-A CRISPR-associated protein Cas4/Csa1 [Candidatus Calditenuis fumarioli]
MFFLRREEFERRIRILRDQGDASAISPELRGWNNSRPPVKPIGRHLLSVSELASRYCPTMRDIYLRRVARIQPPPNFKTFRGLVYHFIINQLTVRSKRHIFERGKIAGPELFELLLEEEPVAVESAVRDAYARVQISEDEARSLTPLASKLYRFLALQVAASVDLTHSRFPHADVDSLVNESIPAVSEMKVDGSLVGLSRELSVDIYTPYNTVIDVKTGDVRSFHRYVGAGYALAIESDKGVEVNFGITLYISVQPSAPAPEVKADYYVIGDELRREFLELRDEAQLLIERGKDPGMPVRCPEFCPYYTICNG